MYRQIIHIVYILLIINSSTLLSNIKIVEENNNFLLLEFKPEFDGFEKILATDGNYYYKPEIENAQINSGEKGDPAQFIVSEMIYVPSPDGFELEETNVFSSSIYDKKIVPYPTKDYETLTHIYVPEVSKYDSFPDEFVNIEYEGIYRGNYVARISFVAAANNNGKIEILEKITAKIKFSDVPKNNKQIKNDFIDIAINTKNGNSWRNNESSDEFLSENDYSDISSGNWFRIEIKEEGIYKITASELSDMGIPTDADAAKTLKIFGHGGMSLSKYVSAGVNNHMNEQEIIVETKENGDIESIIFYAAYTKGFYQTSKGIKHYNNPYSKNNYYLLTFGGREGLRAVAEPTPEGTPVNNPTTYYERLVFEEELICPYPHGGGNQWMGQSFFDAPFIDKLHNLDRNGEILYRFSVAHKADDYSATGNFSITLNDREISKVYLSPTSGEYTYLDRGFSNVSVQASEISSDNRSILEFNYSNVNSAGYTPYLDYYEIHYPRSLNAMNNEIMFFSDDLSGLSEYSINGFSGEIYGFNVTYNYQPKLLDNISTTGGMFIFRDENETFKNDRYYISSKLKSANISKIEIGNLRTDFANTDVIIITHNDLLESANNFKNYREQNSDLSVSIVTTEHIFNEFSSGLPDLTAIRDFISFAYKKWDNPPKYIVLWGDGHYDYKNIATGKVNHIPVYQNNNASESFNEIYRDFATEDFYVRIDGDDDIPDLAIGRITIENNEEGNWIVDKINHYENSSNLDSWRTRAILVADDGPKKDGASDGPLHNDDSEDLTKFIDDDFSKKKIYMVQYESNYVGNEIRKPEVTKDILSEVNTQGGLLLNFVGHGNPNVWTHEYVLERDKHINKMTNLDKLFFLTAATCDYGRFDDPEVRSGAEVFFLSKVGGAIAVFSATRVVFADANSFLNNLLYRNIFERKENGEYKTLGELILRVKQVKTEENDEKFFLLGDPTMKLLIPELNVRIDSVNGTHVSEFTEPVKFKALSELSLSGSITNSYNNDLISDYNGTVILNIHEGDKKFELYEYDDNRPFIFNLAGAAVNKGAFEVKNGKFEANFIVPRDISFTDSLGRLFAYSYSDDDRFAKGHFRQFVVNGISQNINNDNQGPEISVYIDDRSFEEGDIVRNEPLLIVDLFDETGINSTGLGIGHKIEAWIDDDPVSIDLTDKYTSSIKDSRYGTTSDYLDELESGLHKVRVRAWDVFNNYSVSETYFNIAGINDGLMITDNQNFPNPFGNSTKIRLKYNISPPFDADIRIYNSVGTEVYSSDLIISGSLSAEIEWNGKDNNENPLPDGLYVYRIILTDANGQITSVSGKMMKMKD